jgi:hypothetical protein
MAVRLGIAHVSPGYNHGADVLADGADIVAGLADTIKLWAAPTYLVNYPGQTWGGVPTTLTQLAQLAPYAAVFARPEFTRYFLGTWTFSNGVFDPWKGGLADPMLSNEYTELYNFCVHLLSTYSGKDFVIQTAESDWALINNGDQTPFNPGNHIDLRLVDRCVAFYGRRLQAIQDARRAVASTSRVFSCIEVNRVLDNGVRIHTHVLPRLQPDMISWTSYEAINEWAVAGMNQATAEASMAAKMREMVRRVRAETRKVQGLRGDRIPIIAGEFGWPEAHPLFSTTFDAGALTAKFLDTCEELGITDANHWQLWDNEVYTDPEPTHPRRQAIYDENGDATAQGTELISRYS